MPRKSKLVAVRAVPQVEPDSVTEVEAANAVRTILRYIGEDVGREGLALTPSRYVKALDELTAGYHQKAEQILETCFDAEGYDEMVILRGIEFHSTCEHHLLPFSGTAHVAYIPRRKVVGLSKMARLVDCFSRRLQIQERMTSQIAKSMQSALNPLGVGVTVSATHSCMSCRGVSKQQAKMVTTALLGCFRDLAVRTEFFALCK